MLSRLVLDLMRQRVIVLKQLIPLAPLKSAGYEVPISKGHKRFCRDCIGAFVLNGLVVPSPDKARRPVVSARARNYMVNRSRNSIDIVGMEYLRPCQMAARYLGHPVLRRKNGQSGGPG